jgi:pyridinium-3,5-bisthiocarboxylic acid mononucleotide nickel chelatase
LGSGWVKSAHGSMPVPAPATLEILREVPVRFEGVGELTTPTGAALLKALAQIASPGQWVVEKVGYGVGTQKFADRPNVLRASLGRRTAPAEDFWVVEVNLDDCNPQLLGWLLERAIELGAVDAYVVPVTMKKSRPGHLFCAVVAAEKRKPIAELLLTESTTLGVRWYAVDRWMLDRRLEAVSTPWGEVRVKLGLRGEQVVNVQPEYEDCRRLAEKKAVSLKQIMAAAVAAYFAPKR